MIRRTEFGNKRTARSCGSRSTAHGSPARTWRAKASTSSWARNGFPAQRPTSSALAAHATSSVFAGSSASSGRPCSVNRFRIRRSTSASGRGAMATVVTLRSSAVWSERRSASSGRAVASTNSSLAADGVTCRPTSSRIVSSAVCRSSMTTATGRSSAVCSSRRHHAVTIASRSVGPPYSGTLPNAACNRATIHSASRSVRTARPIVRRSCSRASSGVWPGVIPQQSHRPSAISGSTLASTRRGGRRTTSGRGPAPDLVRSTCSNSSTIRLFPIPASATTNAGLGRLPARNRSISTSSSRDRPSSTRSAGPAPGNRIPVAAQAFAAAPARR